MYGAVGMDAGRAEQSAVPRILEMSALPISGRCACWGGYWASPQPMSSPLPLCANYRRRQNIAFGSAVALHLCCPSRSSTGVSSSGPASLYVATLSQTVATWSNRGRAARQIVKGSRWDRIHPAEGVASAAVPDVRREPTGVEFVGAGTRSRLMADPLRRSTGDDDWYGP